MYLRVPKATLEDRQFKTSANRVPHVVASVVT